MGRMAKVLNLINLLHSRSSVSLETIMQACGIPERTAYRYINFISEAGIPVHYDRNAGGYQLAWKKSGFVDDLTFGDLLLLVGCLNMAKCHLNPSYSEDVTALISKIATRSRHPLEEVMASLETQFGKRQIVPDFSIDISSALVQAAVNHDRSVHLTVRNSDSGETTVKFDRPGLVFDKEWKINHRLHNSTVSEAITNVTKVKIV